MHVPVPRSTRPPSFPSRTWEWRVCCRPLVTRHTSLVTGFALLPPAPARPSPASAPSPELSRRFLDLHNPFFDRTYFSIERVNPPLIRGSRVGCISLGERVNPPFERENLLFERVTWLLEPENSLFAPASLVENAYRQFLERANRLSTM